MGGQEVLARVREGLFAEAEVYDRGAWPDGARQVLYARASGAAHALTLAGLLNDSDAVAALAECHQRFGLGSASG